MSIHYEVHSPRWLNQGFDHCSSTATCEPFGRSLTAGRAVESGEISALMRAPWVAVAAAFREKPLEYRYASTCTARAGASLCPIASEVSDVALAVQVSYGCKSKSVTGFFD